MKFLFIGDPHIKSDNSDEIDILLIEIRRAFGLHSPEYIVVAGDVMHYHEKVYTSSLNKALEFVRELSKLAFTYILVGNHDYENNNQFLTQNHWMNALKKWDNVQIVDKVFSYDDYMLVPYVYPKRFIEALESEDEKGECKGKVWQRKKVIFAHQEFKGCKMGAIVSVDGDDWDESYPYVVSGHIHDRQWVGSNIYYPGAPLQHSFGDQEQRVLCMVKWEDGKDDGKEVEIEDVPINVPRKHIFKVTPQDISKDTKKILKMLKETPDIKIKLKFEASTEEFKLFKETKEYREMIEKGVKIQLVKHLNLKKDADDKSEKEVENFIALLEKSIDEDEPMLRTIYNELMGKDI